MKTFAFIAAALVCAAPVLAQKPDMKEGTVVDTSPGKGTVTSAVKASASVTAIDAATRTLTLKGPKGKVFTVVAPPEVKRFDEIKVGDLVVVRYVESLTLELKKGGKAVVERKETEAAGKAKPGEAPAAGAARQVTVMADVTAVNPKTQTITLKGPEKVVDLKLRDPKQFALVKVGDQVEATYTEAMAISIEPKKKPAAKQ